MDFGKRLFAWRKSQDLTQPQVAARIGVTARQVWRWEKGRQYPSAQHIPSLARLLGVPAESLLPAESHQEA